MLKIIIVAGARPNFMKVAPLVEAMNRRSADFQSILVHTGQHYDAAMSDAFFRDLEMPAPDIHLGVGSASHAAQTADVMRAFEPVVLKEKPNCVVVVGDSNAPRWILEAKLQVIVLELAIPRTAVQPARKTRVIRVDEIDLFERFEAEFLQTVMDPAQWKGIGMLDASESLLTNGDVVNRAPGARNADERRSRLVVGKVRDAENVDVWTHVERGGNCNLSQYGYRRYASGQGPLMM